MAVFTWVRTIPDAELSSATRVYAKGDLRIEVAAGEAYGNAQTPRRITLRLSITVVTPARIQPFVGLPL